MQTSSTKLASQPSVDVRRSDLGYFELSEKPTQDELGEYYAKKYYQQQIRTHESTYRDDEIKFRRNKLDQKFRVIKGLYKNALSPMPTFLDIGAGEGFAMDFFTKQGWKVTGLDYSAHGCKTHHPHLTDHLIIGDLQLSVNNLAAEGRRFDAILLDNVLEHLLDPAHLLRSLAPLMADDGVLVIEVPNDFSAFQEYLLEQRKIDRPFWVVAPDHISYFNRDGLARLANTCGFEEHSVSADFPIDLFLFNDHTNYISNSTVGKSCHAVRVEVENLLHSLSPEATIRMYQAMAELGIGRQLVSYFKMSSTQNHLGES
ncbi:MAG: class I SAM-dependent methyltransferase [Oxalobacteraceae bacterium]|nr:class I SAM-dependent methyltransferase [Oxalobacteraceae bacterium]